MNVGDAAGIAAGLCVLSKHRQNCPEFSQQLYLWLFDHEEMMSTASRFEVKCTYVEIVDVMY